MIHEAYKYFSRKFQEPTLDRHWATIVTILRVRSGSITASQFKQERLDLLARWAA